MERNLPKNQVIHPVTLISLLAHHRFLLNKTAAKLNGGIILYCDDSSSIPSALDLLEKAGGIICKIKGSKLPQASNYEFPIVTYTTAYKDSVVKMFLECEDFLPVLIVSGVFPEFLRTSENVLIYEESDARTLSTDLRDYYDYSHEHGWDVVEQIRSSSLIYDEYAPPNDSQLSRALFSVAWAYNQYCAQKEKPTFSLAEQLDYVCKICTIGLNDDFDVTNATAECLGNYIEAYPNEAALCTIGYVDDSLLAEIDKEHVILVNDEYYFVPESLLEQATKDFRGPLSYPVFKDCLYQENTLVCNSSECNYTVKLVIRTKSGSYRRKRFLKLKRTALIRDDSLSLEERRTTQCTYANSMV